MSSEFAFSMNSGHLTYWLYNRAALLIVFHGAEQLIPADPAKPPNDTTLETVPLIQVPIDPWLLIRVKGID